MPNPLKGFGCKMSKPEEFFIMLERRNVRVSCKTNKLTVLATSSGRLLKKRDDAWTAARFVGGWFVVGRFAAKQENFAEYVNIFGVFGIVFWIFLAL